MKNTKNDFFKVITSKTGEVAEMLIYGYIGQDFWWDEQLKEQSITDIEVAKALKSLEQAHNRINIRINSLGGSILHGNAIINAIKTSSAEIHTYNDGIAASIAADIWFASPNRHMAKNALLMVHNSLTGIYGNAQELREMADLLDKYTSTTISVMADALGKTAAEIKAAYYDDYKDHWFTAKEAEEEGFIPQVDDYEGEVRIPDAQKMSHSQLLQAFKSHQEKPNTGIISLMRSMLGLPKKESHLITEKSIPMNKEALQQALTEGEISFQEVADILGSSDGFKVEKVATAEQNQMADLITSAVKAATEPLKQKLEALEVDIKKFGDAPGDTPTSIGKGEDEESVNPILKEHRTDLAEMTDLAKDYKNPFSKRF